jgi:hypothetical protein
MVEGRRQEAALQGRLADLISKLLAVAVRQLGLRLAQGRERCNQSTDDTCSHSADVMVQARRAPHLEAPLLMLIQGTKATHRLLAAMLTYSCACCKACVRASAVHRSGSCWCTWHAVQIVDATPAMRWGNM